MEISTQVAISLIGVVGAAMSVYVALRIANTENLKDIQSLTQIVRQLSDTVQHIDQQCLNHRTSESHVTDRQIHAVEQRISDLIKTLDKLENKIDRLYSK